MAYCDETGEALAAVLRPGNAGSNTAADHVAVVEDALAQIPAELIETIEILVRTDSAGATHDLLGFCREHRLRYSVGYELTDPVRAAILKIPENAWIAALDRTTALWPKRSPTNTRSCFAGWKAAASVDARFCYHAGDDHVVAGLSRHLIRSGAPVRFVP